MSASTETDIDWQTLLDEPIACEHDWHGKPGAYRHAGDAAYYARYLCCNTVFAWCALFKEFVEIEYKDSFVHCSCGQWREYEDYIEWIPIK